MAVSFSVRRHRGAVHACVKQAGRVHPIFMFVEKIMIIKIIRYLLVVVTRE